MKINSNMKPAISIVAFSLFISVSFACRPIMRMYESQCCGDDYVEIAREYIGISNERNLTAKGIQNVYLRTCPEGLWLGFSEPDYAGSSYILASRLGRDGLTTCSYQNTGRRFKSVKIIGSSEDYTARAVVTYTIRYNEGEEHMYENDTRSLPSSTFNSLVIVGHEEVELFTAEGYSGLSVCVRPNNGDIYSWDKFLEMNERLDGLDLYTNLADLSVIFGTQQFHSFKFGCSNSTKSLSDLVNFSNKLA